MPLLQEWDVPPYASAAIWKIEEAEEFFQVATGIISTIKNDKKRIEHLAGRYLLQHLQNDFPLHNIRKDDHDKPRIDKNKFYFSISHSWPYVAVVIDPFSEAGIDIQTWHPRITAIQHKFLSEEEQSLFKNDPKLLTVAWSAKEAAYKWYGNRGVDFIKHLPVSFFRQNKEESEITIYFTLTKIPQMIFIKNIISSDFACSYVLSTQNWAIY